MRTSASSTLPSTRFNEAAAHGRGKSSGQGRPRHRRRRGSMRPRRMAAENPCRRDRHADRGAGSMRPRRMAAENRSSSPSGLRRTCGFNEAAAHGRGKLCGANVTSTGATRGSMRPRRMAAENHVGIRVLGRHRRGFNEAAAHGRGKCGCRCRMTNVDHAWFNEAAAHGRGKWRFRITVVGETSPVQ